MDFFPANTRLIRPAAAAAVLVALPALALGASSHINAPSDVEAIRAIEHDLATSLSMDHLINYYADDAVVLDVFAPGHYRGKKEIYAGFAEPLKSVQSMQGELPDLNILSDGKFACAASQARFVITQKDGKQLKMAMRQVDAYKKVGGHWLIVQQHISFPIDQKAGMGLTNASMPVRGPIQWSAQPLPGPATTPVLAKKEIRSWLEVGALSPDVETLMKYYGPTDDVLVFDLGPQEFRGLKETRDGFASVMNMTDPHMKLLDFNVDSDGNLGVQIDIQQVSLTPKGGKPISFTLRQSDCMRHVGDKWYSVFEELSVPVDPATGKAVMHP
jgi:ketosteroid isomerase-like protein